MTERRHLYGERSRTLLLVIGFQECSFLFITSNGYIRLACIPKTARPLLPIVGAVFNIILNIKLYTCTNIVSHTRRRLRRIPRVCL